MLSNMMYTTPSSRLFQRMLHMLCVGLIAAALTACNTGGGIDEGYDDEDTGSPSQGAPLDGGEIDEDEYNEAEGDNPAGEPDE
jgi:predicted small secreted protein